MNHAGKKPAFFWVLGMLLVAAGVAYGAIYRMERRQELDQALIAAIRRNDTAAVVSVLRTGADANACVRPPDPRPWWQKLRDSLRGTPRSEPALPALLVAFGGDMEHRLAMPTTYAAPSLPQNTVLLEALLRHGANPNIRSVHGETPLSLAIADNKRRDVQLLLKYGADPNWRNMDGLTLLMRSAWRGDTHMVNWLLDRGAQIDTQEPRGATALMYAVASGNVETVAALLRRHADCSLQAENGDTALDEARSWLRNGYYDTFRGKAGRVAIVRLLEKTSANRQDLF